MRRVRENTVSRSSCCGRILKDERARPDGKGPVGTDSALLKVSESGERLSDGQCMHSALGRVFGVDELAILFGCSREKIKRRARRGELPAFKFGKSWYVRERDLEMYMNQAVDSNSRFQKR
jgi:excisionase family DNA binding protein